MFFNVFITSDYLGNLASKYPSNNLPEPWKVDNHLEHISNHIAWKEINKSK